jgi:hypothetical protein
MPLLSQRVLLFGALGCITSCAQTWLDHPTNVQMEQELVERSKDGLALSEFTRDGLMLNLRFFDGRAMAISFECCASAYRGSLRRNRLVTVDTNSAAAPDDPTNSDGGDEHLVGQVVVVDVHGKVLARSELRIDATVPSLSPDEGSFAYVGSLPGQPLLSTYGVYVAGFHDRTPRKLMAVPFSIPPEAYSPFTYVTVDWSPAGESLLLSFRRGVWILNVKTGEARKVADGGLARWSPSGEWISYVNTKREAALINVATGKSTTIDPGRGTGSEIKWSPDSRYLLIGEGEGSHVPYGCLWIYRVSDGAWVPIPGYGIASPHPEWIQLGEAVN